MIDEIAAVMGDVGGCGMPRERLGVTLSTARLRSLLPRLEQFGSVSAARGMDERGCRPSNFALLPANWSGQLLLRPAADRP